MELTDTLDCLRGVGSKRREILEYMGLITVYDLITYYPRNYEDRSKISKISALRAGERACVIVSVMSINETFSKRGMRLIKATVADGTGYMVVTWFNNAYIKKTLYGKKRVLLTGEIEYAYGGMGALAMSAPSFEVLGDASPKGIIPIYRVTGNLTQKQIRSMIEEVFNRGIRATIEDILPRDLGKKYGLMERSEAFYRVHFPQTMKDVALARRRLAFEELYLIQCGLVAMKKQSQSNVQGVKHLANGKLLEKVYASIPFALTNDQKRAFKSIALDMEKDISMRRLVQGDVGSGKTVVAMLALVKTVENDYQGALMAPTGILAQQHYASFKEQLEPFGIRIGLLTGKLTKKEHDEMYEKIRTHQVDIVIGTHALIEDKVKFSRLGLVITDEQHRFGISQRAALEKTNGVTPDVLVMTATPIPRTMTLTVYGDLDVSLIQELPPGRKPVRTFLRSPDRRSLIYKFVKDEIEKGRQAYVVCPLVEESETLDLPSAEEIYEELKGGIFKDIPCALIHGRMKDKDKEDVMENFHLGKTKLLVATTVIEVGVNVPNASVMVIEHAERFGLSQLHQLRGRIGRGEYDSYCIMVATMNSEASKVRLQTMVNITDGFKLAEEDLKLRGPGEFFGKFQHGLGDLKIANALEDADLLLMAREAALIAAENNEDFKNALRLLSVTYKGNFEHILDS
ncbi:MAG: ATP-dependent DNA helicase RecG [Selenomonadaceae bacterium]|nr:ATP-dependent DNA helicase RecG [Selenomonadaceae bacterium]